MNTPALESRRHEQGPLLEALRGVGAKVVSANRIHCPFHEDRHASSGIYSDDAGVWRFKCQALSCGFNGDVFDIEARGKGVQVAELLRGSVAPVKPPKPVLSTADVELGAEAVYRYTHPGTGTVELVVVRRRRGDDKTFAQYRPTQGGWVAEAPPKPWPLYNRGRLVGANAVVVVEGEKCVHALHDIGIIATTSPCGAGKASHADWTPLAGKTVWLWPDADPVDPKTGVRAGIAHMRQVASLLATLDPAPRVFWIDPDSLNLPPKGDVADLLAGVDGAKDEKRLLIESICESSEPLGASAEIKALMDDIISGRRATVAWPWRRFTKLTNSLLPGTITLVCGDPGSAKSFMLLEAAAHWHGAGIKIALLELEEDRAYHLRRTMVIRSGQPALFDDDWVRENPDIALQLLDSQQAFIDTFGARIHDAPDQQMTLADVSTWVERMAMQGCRVIAVDPVTAATSTDKPWVDDLKFVMRLKQTARQFDCSVVLVTHPRKGRKSSSLLEDLAGGAAYSRFAQTVVWMHHHHPAKRVTVRNRTEMGTINESVMVDRIVTLQKTRNASGAGLTLGFRFSNNKLRFHECGVIVKDEHEDLDP